jgi:hypothetical protein
MFAEASPSDFFGRLRYGRSGGLEAYFGMGSIAEWLVDGCAAATERNGGLAGKIDLRSVGVNQLDGTFYAKWSVWSHRDGYFTLSHEHPCSEIVSSILSLAADDAELVAVEVLGGFGFLVRGFWLRFLDVSRGTGGGTCHRSYEVRTLADLLAFPAG